MTLFMLAARWSDDIRTKDKAQLKIEFCPEITFKLLAKIYVTYFLPTWVKIFVLQVLVLYAFPPYWEWHGGCSYYYTCR